MNGGKISVTVALLLSFFVLPNFVQGKYSGGAGEPNDPYQIGSATDLLTLAADANDYDKYFILTADINLDPNLPGRLLFTTAVIAADTDNSNDTFEGTAFTGIFDGAGHKIINLTIDTNGAENDYLGLFGSLVGGNILNLTVENEKITSGNNSLVIGGLAGENDGGINNCYSTVTIVSGESTFDVGGLVGYNGLGDVSNCYSAGTVTCGNSSGELGGLAGSNDETISKCYSTVTITGGDMSESIGGLVGENDYGSIDNCYSTGAVTGGNDSIDIGGFTGYNTFGDISNCYSTGAVNEGAGATYLGGFAGDNFSTIDGCYYLDTSGPDNGIGDPLTDPNMKKQTSFVGWDFVGEIFNGTEDIWWIKGGLIYPKLYWQLEVTKCTVTAGSKPNSDKISFSGQMYVSTVDFNDFNNIINVTIDSNDINKPCDINFPINSKTFKTGKYNYSGTDSNVTKSFTYDTKTHKFAFAASKLNLLGLGCPVTIEIEIGDYVGTTEVNETIVNGPKTPIPIKLMMRAKNVLRVDKCQVQQGKDPNSDKLTASGAFAVEDPDVNMAAYDFVITLGTQTFTLPAGSLKPGRGKFSCSKAPLTEGGTADVTFNFSLCSFTLTIKNTEITVDPGTIDFGFDFAGFDENVQIVLAGSALLQGAVDYTGSYPELNTVSYTDNGKTVHVPAHPGQVLVFFKTPISETAAKGLFTAAGGTILAKIPKAGYYLVGVAVGGENAFISAVSADARVSSAIPNMIGVRGSGVALLEGCGDAHYTGVRAAFINNGGLDDKCRDIYNGDANQSTFHKIVVEILKEANQNGKGPTLINLSSYGTAVDDHNNLVNGQDWETFDTEGQLILQNAWYTFMAITLNAIAALPAEYRENLVITVAAGNNNMPVCSGITRLLNSRFADIFRNNVLVVSTTSMPGNYCAADPNVAVLNNAEAANGTSFATPAALALIQNIMRLSGVSAKEALQAVKRAVAANADYELIPSEAINQTQFTLSIAMTGTGSGTVTAFPLPNGPNDTYIVGTMVTLTATAYTGSTFTGWSGDVTGTGKSVKITMDGNKSVTAAFAKSTTAAKYIGSFSGSTTSGMLGCFWLNTVSGTGTITVTGSNTGTFKVSGIDHITVLPGSDPKCKGGSESASYSGPLLIDVDDGNNVSADITNSDGSANFVGTINDDHTITGTLTLDAYGFDSPIVGPLTLYQQ